MNLPGSIHPAYPEDKCESHPGVQAVVNVQGETDSFGCEMHPMCQACYLEYQKQPTDRHIGECDFCHTKEVARQPIRDYDEGSSGPVYYVCRPCRKKKEEADLKEYNAMMAEDDGHMDCMEEVDEDDRWMTEEDWG